VTDLQRTLRIIRRFPDGIAVPRLAELVEFGPDKLRKILDLLAADNSIEPVRIHVCRHFQSGYKATI